jgi:hypothetical protein
LITAREIQAQWWTNTGAQPDAPEVIGLASFLDNLIEKQLYIENLSPDDLVWDGKKWMLGESFFWGAPEQRVRKTKQAERLYDTHFNEFWTHWNSWRKDFISVVKLNQNQRRGEAGRNSKKEETIKKFSGKTFEVGEKFKTAQGNHIFEVIKALESGSDRAVYKIKNENGQEFVIKIPRSQSEEDQATIDKEIERTSAQKKAGLSHAKVYEVGKDYVIREWTQGLRGDDWLLAWAREGYPTNSPGWKELVQLLKKSISKGIYVGKLDPEDLIWTGKKWVIVDSGGVKTDLSKKEISERYYNKMLERWGGKVGSTKFSTCELIFGVLAK